MAAIWQNDSGKWTLVAPTDFIDEDALHSRVEEAPELLPLAGNPDLFIAGREVYLGNGKADLIAVEASGRPVVIEVKLARNPEARRAVVAQILTYAAYLRGLSIERLEGEVLQEHLAKRGHATLTDLVAGNDQTGSFDKEQFEAGLARSLQEGRFRLVLVLDGVPDELMRLVGYLALIAEKVLIDLVTVSYYSIGGRQILVPQRVDPEYQSPQLPSWAADTPVANRITDGVADFEAAIDEAPAEHRQSLTTLLNWARSLERLSNVRLQTYRGKNGSVSLLPRLRPENVGLVTLYRDNQGGSVQFFRGVFERHAEHSIAQVENVLGTQLKQGNMTRAITPALLDAMTAAYEEAAASRA